MSKTSTLRCKGCGKPEKISPLGYTNIAPALGYCADCINRAMDAIRKEEA